MAASGKLKASSYTLDKINDVKCMEWASEGRQLEFATVGRGQIHFWAFNQDDKLEYYNAFIPKKENGEISEITACEYMYWRVIKIADRVGFGRSTGYGVWVAILCMVELRAVLCSEVVMPILYHRNQYVVGILEAILYC